MAGPTGKALFIPRGPVVALLAEHYWLLRQHVHGPENRSNSWVSMICNGIQQAHHKKSRCKYLIYNGTLEL